MYCKQNASRSLDPRDEFQTKSDTTCMKVISKQDFLQPYLDNVFSDVQSCRIAQNIERYIKAVRKFHRETPYFVEAILNRLYYLHKYNVKVAEVTSEYPLTSNLTQLMLRYIVLESNVLYKYRTRKYAAKVEERILRLLHHIYDAYLATINIPPEKLLAERCKAILQLIIKVKIEFEVQNDLMENIAKKLLMKMGSLEQVNILQKQCMSRSLDSCLHDPEFVQIYKNIITSDYGTDDDLRFEEEKNQANVERDKSHNIDQENANDEIFILEEQTKTTSKFDRRQQDLEEKRQLFLLREKENDIFSFDNPNFGWRKPSTKVFELDFKDVSETNNENSPSSDDVIIIDDDDDKTSIKKIEKVSNEEEIFELSSDEDDDALNLISNEREEELLKEEEEDTEDTETIETPKQTSKNNDTINSMKEIVHNNVTTNTNCPEMREHENKTNLLPLQTKSSRVVETVSLFEIVTVTPTNTDLELKNNLLLQHENSTSNDRLPTPEIVDNQKDLEKCSGKIVEQDSVVIEIDVSDVSDKDTNVIASMENNLPHFNMTIEENLETVTSEGCIEKCEENRSNFEKIQALKIVENASDVDESIDEVNTVTIKENNYSSNSVTDAGLEIKNGKEICDSVIVQDNLDKVTYDTATAKEVPSNTDLGITNLLPCSDEHTSLEDKNRRETHMNQENVEKVILEECHEKYEEEESDCGQDHKIVENETDKDSFSKCSAMESLMTHNKSLNQSDGKENDSDNVELQDASVLYKSKNDSNTATTEGSGLSEISVSDIENNVELQDASILDKSINNSNISTTKESDLSEIFIADTENDVELEDASVLDKSTNDSDIVTTKESDLSEIFITDTENDVELEDASVLDESTNESNIAIIKESDLSGTCIAHMENDDKLQGLSVLDKSTNDSNIVSTKESDLSEISIADMENDVELQGTSVLDKLTNDSDIVTIKESDLSEISIADTENDVELEDASVLDKPTNESNISIAKESDLSEISVADMENNVELEDASVLDESTNDSNISITKESDLSGTCISDMENDGKLQGLSVLDKSTNDSNIVSTIESDLSEISIADMENDVELQRTSVLNKSTNDSDIVTIKKSDLSEISIAGTENDVEIEDALVLDKLTNESNISTAKESDLSEISMADTKNNVELEDAEDKSTNDCTISISKQSDLSGTCIADMENDVELQGMSVLDKSTNDFNISIAKESDMSKISIADMENYVELQGTSVLDKSINDSNIVTTKESDLSEISMADTENDVELEDASVLYMSTNDSNISTIQESDLSGNCIADMENDVELQAVSVLDKSTNDSNIATTKQTSRSEISVAYVENIVPANKNTVIKNNSSGNSVIQNKTPSVSFDAHVNQDFRNSEIVVLLTKCNEKAIESNNLEVQDHNVNESGKDLVKKCISIQDSVSTQIFQKCSQKKDNSREISNTIKVQNSMNVNDTPVGGQLRNNFHTVFTNPESANVLKNNFLPHCVDETSTNITNSTEKDSDDAENLETLMLDQYRDNSNEKENDFGKASFEALDLKIVDNELVTDRVITKTNGVTTHGVIQQNILVSLVLANSDEEISDTLAPHLEKLSDKDVVNIDTIDGNIEKQSAEELVEEGSEMRDNTNCEGPGNVKDTPLEDKLKTNQINLYENPHKTFETSTEIINSDTELTKDQNCNAAEREKSVAGVKELHFKETNDNNKTQRSSDEIIFSDTYDEDNIVPLGVSEVEIALPESKTNTFNCPTSEDMDQIEMLSQTTIAGLPLPNETDKEIRGDPDHVGCQNLNSESTLDNDSTEPSTQISILNPAEEVEKGDMTAVHEVNLVSQEEESSLEHHVIIADQDKSHAMTSTFDSMVKNDSSITDRSQFIGIHEVEEYSNVDFHSTINNTIQFEEKNEETKTPYDCEIFIRQNADLEVGELVEIVEQSTLDEIDDQNEHVTDSEQNETSNDAVINIMKQSFEKKYNEEQDFSFKNGFPKQFTSDNVLNEWNDYSDDSNKLHITKQGHDIKKAVSKFSQDILKNSLVETITTFPNETLLSQPVVQHLDISDNENTGLIILAITASNASREEVVIKKKKVPNRRKLTQKKKNDCSSKIEFKPVQKKPVSQKRELTEKKNGCTSKSQFKPVQKKPISQKRSKKILVTADVTENKRVTRSAQITKTYSDTKCKPHDFVISNNSVVPASNNIYTQKLSDVHLTSEDSNDSEGILLIDEGIDNKNCKVTAEICTDDTNGTETSSNEKLSLYNEDTLDENIVFNFEPKVKGTVLLSIPDNYQESFDLLAQIEQLDKYSCSKLQNLQTNQISGSVGTDPSPNSFEDNKMSTETISENIILDTIDVQELEQSHLTKEILKPIRTKAEKKDYDKFFLKPYVSIERLNIISERGESKYKTVRSKSLDMSMIKNVYDGQLLTKETVKPLEGDDFKHKSASVPSPELEQINSQQTNTMLEQNGSTKVKSEEDNPCNENENNDSDDDIPLSNRIRHEPKQIQTLSSSADSRKQKSSHKDLNRESKESSKQKSKTKTKNNHINKDISSAVSINSLPSCFNESIPAVATISTIKLEIKAENSVKTIKEECVTETDVQTKSKASEDYMDTSGEKYHTTPKLRRKSESRQNLNLLGSKQSIIHVDKKYYTHPKLRRKSILENDAASEDTKRQQKDVPKLIKLSSSNIDILFKCKNTISPTTEKLKKKLQIDCIELSPTDSISEDNSVNDLHGIGDSNDLAMSTSAKTNEVRKNIVEENVCTRNSTKELETVEKVSHSHSTELKLNTEMKFDKNVSEINEVLVSEAESSVQEPSISSLEHSDTNNLSISDQTALPKFQIETIHDDISITEIKIITSEGDTLKSNISNSSDIETEDNLDNLPLSERSTLSQNESVKHEKMEIDTKQLNLEKCSEVENSNMLNQSQTIFTEEKVLEINKDEHVYDSPRKIKKSQTKLIRNRSRSKWTKSRIKVKPSKINKGYNHCLQRMYNNDRKSLDKIMLTQAYKKHVKNGNNKRRANKMESSEKLTKSVNGGITALKKEKNSIHHHLLHETTNLKGVTMGQVCKNNEKSISDSKQNTLKNGSKRQLIKEGVNKEGKGKLAENKKYIHDNNSYLKKPNPLNDILSTNKVIQSEQNANRNEDVKPELKKSETGELTELVSKDETILTENDIKKQTVSNQNTLTEVLKTKDTFVSQLDSINLKTDMESHDLNNANMSRSLESVDDNIISEGHNLVTATETNNITDIGSQNADKEQVPSCDTFDTNKNISETLETVAAETTGTDGFKKIELSEKPSMEHIKLVDGNTLMTSIDDLNKECDSQNDMSLQQLHNIESEKKKGNLKRNKDTPVCDISGVSFDHVSEKSAVNVNDLLIKDVDSENVWQETSTKQDVITKNCDIVTVSSNFMGNPEKSTEINDLEESEKDHEGSEESQNKDIMPRSSSSDKSTKPDHVLTNNEDLITQNQSTVSSHDYEKPIELKDALIKDANKELPDENRKLPDLCDSSTSPSVLLDHSCTESIEPNDVLREIEKDKNCDVSITSSHLFDQNSEKSSEVNILLTQDVDSENACAEGSLNQEKMCDSSTTASNLDNSYEKSIEGNDILQRQAENMLQPVKIHNHKKFVSRSGECENTLEEYSMKLHDTQQNYDISITSSNLVSDQCRKSTEIKDVLIREVELENQQKEVSPNQSDVPDLLPDVDLDIFKEVTVKQDSVTSTAFDSKSPKVDEGISMENKDMEKCDDFNKFTENNNEVENAKLNKERIVTISKGTKKKALVKRIEISEQKPDDSQSKNRLMNSKNNSKKQITNLENNVIDIKLKNIEDAFRKYMPSKIENSETTNRKRRKSFVEENSAKKSKLSEINVDMSSSSEIQSTSNKSPKLSDLSISPGKKQRKDIDCIINQLTEDKESKESSKSQLNLEPMTVNVDVCTLRKKLLRKIKGHNLEQLQEDTDIIEPVIKNLSVQTEKSVLKSNIVQSIDEVSSVTSIKDDIKLETNKENILEIQNISTELDTTSEKGTISKTSVHDLKENISGTEDTTEKLDIFDKTPAVSIEVEFTSNTPNFTNSPDKKVLNDVESSNPEISDVQTAVCKSPSRKDNDSGSYEIKISTPASILAAKKFKEGCGDENEERMIGLEENVMDMSCINKENLEITIPSPVISPEVSKSSTVINETTCNTSTVVIPIITSCESSLVSTPAQGNDKNLERKDNANSFNVPKEMFPLEIPSKKTSPMNPCVKDFYATNVDETNLVNLCDLILNEQFIPMSEVDTPKNMFNEYREKEKLCSNKHRNCLFSLNNQINTTNTSTLASSSASLNLQNDHFIKIPMDSNQTFDLISPDTIIQTANGNHFMDDISIDNENNDITEARCSNTIDHDYTLESPGGPLLSERSEEDQMFPITFDRNLVDSPGEFPLNDNQLPSELGESDDTYKLNIHNEFAVKSLVMLGGQKVDVNPFPLPNYNSAYIERMKDSLFSEDSISNSEENSNSLDTTSLVTSMGQQTDDIPNDASPWTQFMANKNPNGNVSQNEQCLTSFSLSQKNTIPSDSRFNEYDLLKLPPEKEMNPNIEKASQIIPNDANNWTQFLSSDNPNEVVVVSQNEECFIPSFSVSHNNIQPNPVTNSSFDEKNTNSIREQANDPWCEKATVQKNPCLDSSFSMSQIDVQTTALTEKPEVSDVNPWLQFIAGDSNKKVVVIPNEQYMTPFSISQNDLVQSTSLANPNINNNEDLHKLNKGEVPVKPGINLSDARKSSEVKYNSFLKNSKQSNQSTQKNAIHNDDFPPRRKYSRTVVAPPKKETNVGTGKTNIIKNKVQNKAEENVEQEPVDIKTRNLKNETVENPTKASSEKCQNENVPAGTPYLKNETVDDATKASSEKSQNKNHPNLKNETVENPTKLSSEKCQNENVLANTPKLNNETVENPTKASSEKCQNENVPARTPNLKNGTVDNPTKPSSEKCQNENVLAKTPKLNNETVENPTKASSEKCQNENVLTRTPKLNNETAENPTKASSEKCQNENVPARAPNVKNEIVDNSRKASSEKCQNKNVLARTPNLKNGTVDNPTKPSSEKCQNENVLAKTPKLNNETVENPTKASSEKCQNENVLTRTPKLNNETAENPVNASSEKCQDENVPARAPNVKNEIVDNSRKASSEKCQNKNVLANTPKLNSETVENPTKASSEKCQIENVPARTPNLKNGTVDNPTKPSSEKCQNEIVLARTPKLINETAENPTKASSEKCQNKNVQAKTLNLKNEPVDNRTKASSDIPVKRPNITFNSAELVKSQKRAAAIKCTNYSSGSPTRETKSAKSRRTQRPLSRSKTSTPDVKPNTDSQEEHKSKNQISSATSTLTDKSVRIDPPNIQAEKGTEVLDTGTKCLNDKEVGDDSKKSLVSTEIESTTAMPEPCQINASKYNYSIDSILSKEPKRSTSSLNETLVEDYRPQSCQGLKRTLTEIDDEIKRKQMKPDRTDMRDEKTTKAGLNQSKDIDIAFDNLLQQANVNELIHFRITEDNKLKMERKPSPLLKPNYKQNACRTKEQNNLKKEMVCNGLTKPHLNDVDQLRNDKSSPMTKDNKYFREQVVHKYVRSAYPFTNNETISDHLRKQENANEPRSEDNRPRVPRKYSPALKPNSKQEARAKKVRSSYSRTMEINKEAERWTSQSYYKNKDFSDDKQRANRERLESARSRSREDSRADPYDKSYSSHSYFRSQQGRDRSSYSDRVRGKAGHHPGYTREGHHTEHPRLRNHPFKQPSGSSRTSTASHMGRSSNVSETYYDKPSNVSEMYYDNNSLPPQSKTQPTPSTSHHNRGPYTKEGTTLSKERMAYLLKQLQKRVYEQIHNSGLNKNSSDDDHVWREKLDAFNQFGGFGPHTRDDVSGVKLKFTTVKDNNVVTFKKLACVP